MFLAGFNKRLTTILASRIRYLALKQPSRVAVLALILILATLLPVAFLASTSKSTNTAVLKQSFKPTMRVSVGEATEGNRISNSLNAEIAAREANGSSNVFANVIVMLNSTPGTADTAAFSALGGSVISGLWTHALYGFAGRIPFGKIYAFVNSRSDVLLVEDDAVCNASVAYAAEQVGARPYVWSTLGLQGDPNSAIAILDTGIDASHFNFSPGYGNGNLPIK